MTMENNNFIYIYVRDGEEYVTPSINLAYKRTENGEVFEKPLVQ